MINRTILVGRLTRDPELRHIQGGTAVASFTLAVNRQFTNSQGEREADFINCVIWRKAAENFVKLVHKGSLVGIDGRLQTRNYENKQGNRVYVTEVVVDNFSLLEARYQAPNDNSSDSTNVNANQAPSNNQSNNSSNSNSSSNSRTNIRDPFADNSKPMDISDDDLPF